MPKDVEPKGQRQLHVCNNFRSLAIAVFDGIAKSCQTTIIYLQDHNPLPQDVIDGIGSLSDRIDLVLTSDKEQLRDFVNLPTFFPEIIRRNLRLDLRRGVISPKGFTMFGLEDRHFDECFVYHTGFFTSKLVVSMSRTVTMREAGINNYVEHNVSGIKMFFRYLSGMPPRRQSFGEEKWIKRIEASNPAHLPNVLQSKAVEVDLWSFSKLLSRSQKRRLSSVFGVPSVSWQDDRRKRAIVLTQPIDIEKNVTEIQKVNIYKDIADNLSAAGYEVFIKNHPSEAPFRLPNAQLIEGTFPVELWCMLGNPKFHLAVALCSASLTNVRQSFCTRQIQIFSPSEFLQTKFSDVTRNLNEKL